jgi:antibiotic biosynthesis monooxygenase (ABM) superfamily enzyme
VTIAGNTAIVGGFADNSRVGAAWVYTRSGGVWTQQGGKLVANDAVGAALQGYSVALSSDGNTAITGGPFDNAENGAAWVYTRSGGVWAQEGSKLVGTGAVGNFAQQGYSVALSGVLDPAGRQAGRYRRGWARPTRPVRRVGRRRRHSHCGRGSRQPGRRSGMGLHPERRYLDPAG